MEWGIPGIPCFQTKKKVQKFDPSPPVLKNVSSVTSVVIESHIPAVNLDDRPL